MSAHEARYPLPLTEAEQQALEPDARREHQAKRRAFDREYEHHMSTARDQGFIDVGVAGRVVKFATPNARRT